MERYCNLAEDGIGAADADCAVTLVLKDSEAGMKDALSGVSACEWHLAKLCAPKEVVVRESVLSEEEVSRGTRRLADAVKLREERFDQLTRHAIAVHPEEEERMRVAGENAEELTAFLEKDDNPDRKKLLDSLTKKDNKDLRAEVLEDHLSAKARQLVGRYTCTGSAVSQNLAGRNRRLQKLHLQCADCSGAGSICLQSRADMELCKPKHYRYPGRRI